MKKILILSAALISFATLVYGLRLWVAPLAELSDDRIERIRRPKQSNRTRPDVTSETLHTGQAHPVAPSPVRPTDSASPSEDASEQPLQAQFEDPEALMQFADYLEPKLDVAEESLPMARELFAELETCISGDAQRGGVAVQAMCLSGAEELSDMHAELAPKFEELKRRAPPNVVSLMDGDEIVE